MDTDETVGTTGPRGYLSYSQMSTYNSCSEKYRLNYVDKVPRQEPGGAALAGSVIHEVIADSEANGWWVEPDINELRRQFVTRFVTSVNNNGGEEQVRWGGRKSKAFPQGEDMEWWLFNGPVMLRRYADIRQGDVALGIRMKAEHVESKVSVLVDIEGHDEPVSILGYIDAMTMVTGDGEAIVRDWKSGTWSDPLQLAFYAWMLAHTDRPLTVVRGELVKLRGNTRDKQVLSYDVTKWVPVMPKMVAGALRGIEREVFAIQPGMLCPSCSVREYCDYGKTLNVEVE